MPITTAPPPIVRVPVVVANKLCASDVVPDTIAPLPDMVKVEDSVVAPETVSASESVAASDTVSVPTTVVADPDADKSMAPPPIVKVLVVVANKLCASDVVPDTMSPLPDMVKVEDSVVAPETVSASESVAASDTVSVPTTVVADPDADKSMAPPPIVKVLVVVANKLCASDVVPETMAPLPDMVKVEDSAVAPETVRASESVAVCVTASVPPTVVAYPAATSGGLWLTGTAPTAHTRYRARRRKALARADYRLRADSARWGSRPEQPR